MKKVENKIFILTIFIILIGGFIKPIINPKDINNYENRPANKIPEFSLNNFLAKNYQDNFEKALADQIPLSNKMKILAKTFSLETKLLYAKINKNNYNNLGSGIYFINGNLVYKNKSLPSVINNLNNRISNYNKIASEITDTDFYVYYIEKDTDINFDNNEKSQIYEYIKDNLSPQIKSSVFQINNFADFQKYFYKTDHHWNYEGSYKAYQEISKLLEITEPLNKAKEKFCLNSKLSGSKAGKLGGSLLLKEPFCAYKFIFPEHKIYINNKLVNNYGNYLEYYQNLNMPVTYANFYGWDDGLVEFDYETDAKENLLIIGESYDNAINELISTHFSKTFNIDLRAYKQDLNKDLDIKNFIKENKIDKVLLIGNIDYFTMEIFKLS